MKKTTLFSFGIDPVFFSIVCIWCGVCAGVCLCTGCTSNRTPAAGLSADDAAFATVVSPAAFPCNVYPVAVPPVSNPAAADEFALKDAARRIVMEQELFVFYGRVEESDARYVYASDESAYGYDTEKISDTAARLAIVSRKALADGQTLILVQDPAGNPAVRAGVYGLSNSTATTNAGTAAAGTNAVTLRKPDWISAPPVIAGCRVAVGFSDAYRFRADTLFAADIAAAQELVMQQDTAVRGYSFQKDRGTSLAQQAGTVTLSRGTIRGFTVIDRWYDFSSGAAYSLAVCVR